MQSILSTHVRPEVFGHLFRLNLTVVRSVSGLPGLVRASPALFISWVSLQVFGQRHKFGFYYSAWLLGNGWTAFFHLFRMDSPPFFVVVVTAVSRLVAPNSIHYTSLDSHCAGQVKHSLARFNQTVIILRRNFTKLET